MSNIKKYLTPKKSYRPELDGLRALAVMAVMFSHYEIFDGILEGGYLGVDIFFVLSGYLIAQQLLNHHKANFFSCAKFLLRRVKRLFPALYVTVSLVFILSFFILTPSQFDDNSKITISSLLFISNFFFMGNVDYFDLAAVARPLLHIWSIGLEMQFYAFFAISFSIFVRFFSLRIFFYFLSILSVLSLFFAEIFSDINSSYYFLGSRLWEFYVGILAAILHEKNIGIPERMASLSLFAGFFIIFSSFIFFDGQTAHPGFVSLVPCVGAFLIIFQRHHDFKFNILNSSWLILLGRISFSTYLLHWPILVLLQLALTRELFLSEKVCALLFTLLGSYLLFLAIENKFRYAPVTNRYALVAFGSVVSGSIICVLIASSLNFAAVSKTDFSQVYQDDIIKQKVIESTIWNSNKEFDGFRDPRTNILVLGDSHSVDVAMSLLVTKNAQQAFEIARRELDDPCLVGMRSLADSILGFHSECDLQWSRLLKDSVFHDAEYVLVANYWELKYAGRILPGIERLIRLTDSPIALIGPAESFPLVENAVARLGPTTALNEYSFVNRAKDLKPLIKSLYAVAEELEIEVIRRDGIACDDTRLLCLIYQEGEGFLYSDDNHWSLAGEKTFGVELTRRILNDAISIVERRSESK